VVFGTTVVAGTHTPHTTHHTHDTHAHTHTHTHTSGKGQVPNYVQVVPSSPPCGTIGKGGGHLTSPESCGAIATFLHGQLSKPENAGQPTFLCFVESPSGNHWSGVATRGVRAREGEFGLCLIK
jgi:hypothetical protein